MPSGEGRGVTHLAELAGQLSTAHLQPRSSRPDQSTGAWVWPPDVASAADPRSRVPQLSRRLVTRNRPLSRADVMITGVAPRYQAHRNFSGAPLCRSAAWRASQTAHRRALEEFRCRDLCPKATSGLVGAGGPAGASGLV